MKVSIIGGGGLVGSMAAYALQFGRAASHICIIDANKDVAQGVALDLLQGSCLVADQRITAGTMEDVSTSNIIVITAGLRRKPDESRLDLINRNVDLFLNLLQQAKSAGIKENTHLVVVSNPVDILTYLAGILSGLDPKRIMGLGTVLDTARFRSHIAKRLQVAPTQVQALLLGEHGDSMVPIWSSATVAGLPLEQFPGCNPQLMKDAFEETKTAGATMIKLKGGSGFAVGASIAEVVQSIILDSRKILPVSSLQNGLYGVHDVCLSVPTEVGCGGVRKLFELALTPKERIGIQQSGKLLRDIIDQVEARIGNTNSVAIGASSPINPQSNPQGKILPRSAWQPSRKY